MKSTFFLILIMIRWYQSLSMALRCNQFWVINFLHQYYENKAQWIHLLLFHNLKKLVQALIKFNKQFFLQFLSKLIFKQFLENWSSVRKIYFGTLRFWVDLDLFLLLVSLSFSLLETDKAMPSLAWFCFC